MPKPSLRTRRKKRCRIKSSGGHVKTHYGKKKTGSTRCANCGKVLSGVPSSTPSGLHRLPTSQRRIERMHGGHLCHICLQDLIKLAARKI